MQSKELDDIIARIIFDVASDEDIKTYNGWCRSLQRNTENPPGFSAIQPRIHQLILNNINHTAKLRSVSWYRIAVAASLLLLVSIGGYFLKKHTSVRNAPFAYDIKPGGNKAVLLLANGRQIDLTTAKIGAVMLQQGAKVVKKTDGQVVYDIGLKNEKINELEYNTIKTPVGGQFEVNLADGTKIWLNSLSSIKYPVKFTGTERKVELTGEAYFEVAPNKAKPFKVISPGQTIKVLGTHFNVNTYSDESAAKTTLLEGSIKISNYNSYKIISPGQQATVQNGITIKYANTEEAVAWKNGYFRFNGEKIQTIMRQLSKWYDIEVAYSGTKTNEEFYATISKYRNISEVLSMLQNTKGVHFKIEGRRVTVMQ